MAWNEENIAVLRELYALGMPTRRIAAELGMTKNQVIGKAGRLGFEHPNSTSPVQIYHPPYRKIETPDYAHCQFPTGDVGEAGFHFCGDTAKVGSSYCAGTSYAVPPRPARPRRRLRALVEKPV
jgi:hypothetical protein